MMEETDEADMRLSFDKYHPIPWASIRDKDGSILEGEEDGDYSKKSLHKVTPMRPEMSTILEEVGVKVIVDKKTGATTTVGIQMGNPYVSPTEKTRKRRTSDDMYVKLEQPGRICGNSPEFTYKLDMIQILKKTDSEMMRWIFYWMIVVLPRHRIIPESYDDLLKPYRHGGKYSEVVMRATFLLFVMRIPEVQELVCCGCVPPYQFCAVNMKHLLTVILGRIAIVEPNVPPKVSIATTSIVSAGAKGGLCRKRRTYIGGFYRWADNFIMRTIDSDMFVTGCCELARDGGIHGVYKKLKDTHQAYMTEAKRVVYGSYSTDVSLLIDKVPVVREEIKSSASEEVVPPIESPKSTISKPESVSVESEEAEKMEDIEVEFCGEQGYFDNYGSFFSQ